MSAYAFARSPRWLVSHLAVLALIVAMLSAGSWQLRRHDERAERNALIAQRADVAAVALADALGTGDADQLQFTRVQVAGHYVDEDTVLVANRTVQGSPGFWVMTPVRAADGPDVYVARGFIGRSIALAGDPAAWAAGEDPVTVVGPLQPSVSGGVQAPDREVTEVNRPDTALLASIGDIEDLGLYLQAESDAAPALAPVPLPDLDGGPHRGYAAQWFIFSLIAIVGYPLILRKVARDRVNQVAGGAAGTLAADVSSF